MSAEDADPRARYTGYVVAEAGRLGSGSRIDVAAHPPTITSVEYELDPYERADLVSCGPVFLVSDRLASRLAASGLTGFDLVEADVLPAPREELDDEFADDDPLPDDAPERYRWIRQTPAEHPDLVLHPSGSIEVSAELLHVLRTADLTGSEVDPEPDAPRERPPEPPERLTGWVSFHGAMTGELPLVDAIIDETGDRDDFATMSAGLAWARARTETVVAQTDGERFSAGVQRIPELPVLTDEVLRRVDAEIVATRRRTFEESLVHAAPRPWYLVILSPDTNLDLVDAERLVRGLPDVHRLERRSHRDGDVLWVIGTEGRSERDVQAVEGRIARALWPDERLGSTVGEGFFTFGSGEQQRIGLLEHLGDCDLLSG
ncbi:hypothetical protein [Patulibacter minatonensis]|uniref:hypothetical protein n=1 Tax=Patulibacter minatonensis TaxID=298163 RepID=UPI00047ADE97|nr:hypothetical protein [Patulibacter minatonensis]